MNVGCGHGPDFIPLAGKLELYGVDFSSRMVQFARKYSRKHGFEAGLVVGDARKLPFRDESFDYAVSIAAYHNIKGRHERRGAFAELFRVARPGGEVFLTVWNRWQPGFWFSGKEAMVPWRTKNKVLNRYYHLYSRGELVSDLRSAGFQVLSVFPERSYRLPIPWFSRNICVLATRPVTATA